MGKKIRCRSKKTSKGQRNSISPSTIRLVREGRSEVDKQLNKIKAWRRGKKGFVTIQNPNSSETDKPYIKVTFEQFFKGTYKDVKNLNRSSEDKDRIEI